MISWIARCPVFQSPDYYGTGHRAQGTGHRAQGTEHRPEALTDGGASVAQSTGLRAQGTGWRH